jgi:Glycosyltransferase sugar-binding region containing DXD motif
LAIESLLQTNPKAKITVHFQDPPNNTDWQALQSKVEFRAIDLPSLLSGLPPEMAKVIPVLESISTTYLAGKSNILRYLILYREGGIYLDFDTITVRDYQPLLKHSAFIGEEAVFRYDDDRVSGKFKVGIIPTGILFGLSFYLSLWNLRYLGDSKFLNRLNKILMLGWSDKKLNNAVLGSEPGNGFFGRAISLVSETDPTIKYALGPILMNRTWQTEAATAMHRLNSDHFYCIPPSQTYRFFYGPAPELPEAVFSIHWCSSNHKNLASTLTLENLGRKSANPTLFHKLAYEVIQKGI